MLSSNYLVVEGRTHDGGSGVTYYTQEKSQRTRELQASMMVEGIWGRKKELGFFVRWFGLCKWLL